MSKEKHVNDGLDIFHSFLALRIVDERMAFVIPPKHEISTHNSERRKNLIIERIQGIPDAFGVSFAREV